MIFLVYNEWKIVYNDYDVIKDVKTYNVMKGEGGYGLIKKYETQLLNNAINYIQNSIINEGDKNMESKPLTFRELKIGEHFIDFPTDGDDSGHGGFRKGSYVFIKTKPTPSNISGLFENAVRKIDKIKTSFPDTMQVYKVIM